MNCPGVSVISACYNHGRFVREMIDSVLNQTFQEFEIIIVNDGSTDNTKDILDSIRHEKLRIIHTDHKGPSHARNVAIREANSPFIFNLDSDDKIAVDLLEKGYGILLDNPKAGIVYTEVRYFGSRAGKMNLGTYSLERMLTSNRIVSAAFFRREDWDKTGGYSESYVFGLEDWDFWLSIIELGREVIKIPDSFLYYRVYSDPRVSRSGRINSDRKRALESILLVYKSHDSLYSRFPGISDRFSRLEAESNSVLKRTIKNMLFPLKHRLACLIS